MSLISVTQLSEIIDSENLRIVDARFGLADANAGCVAFAEAHIPGALYVDLNTDLSSEKNDPLLGRHPLPSAEQFGALLSRLGITPQTHVVVYDQADAAMAASRFWFLLRLAGHKYVSVLNGGMNAWLATGLPVEQHASQPEATHYPVHFQTNMLVSASELKALLAKSSETVLLDARAPERFRGEVEPLDKKAGHIPGALNRPFSENMIDGKFKSAEQLRAEFAALIAGKTHILLSCGSGVTACHNALALSHAGIENYRLFAPSWSGWVADDKNPVAVGDT
jgi:thiosulfate/3-mercaptopyruvate sulfurtransferase